MATRAATRAATVVLSGFAIGGPSETDQEEIRLTAESIDRETHLPELIEAARALERAVAWRTPTDKINLYAIREALAKVDPK